MTEPTQAQIDAAAKALNDLVATADFHVKYEDMAKAALTAAAEVGEETEWQVDIRCARREERERCAKVAEGYFDNHKYCAADAVAAAIAIAAAIRALKEEKQ